MIHTALAHTFRSQRMEKILKIDVIAIEELVIY